MKRFAAVRSCSNAIGTVKLGLQLNLLPRDRFEAPLMRFVVKLRIHGISTWLSQIVDCHILFRKTPKSEFSKPQTGGCESSCVCDENPPVVTFIASVVELLFGNRFFDCRFFAFWYAKPLKSKISHCNFALPDEVVAVIQTRIQSDGTHDGSNVSV